MTRLALIVSGLSLGLTLSTWAQTQWPSYLDPDPERAADLISILGTRGRAPLPRVGTYRSTGAHSGTSKVLQMGEERSEITYELLGVSLSDSGEGLLHGASFRCLGAVHAIQGAYDSDNGFCEYTGPDGDQAFLTYRGSGRSGMGSTGTFTLVGGTGKLAGVTGGGEYTDTSPRPTSAGKFHGYWKGRWTYRLP